MISHCASCSSNEYLAVCCCTALMKADGRNRSDKSNPSFSSSPFACFSNHSPKAIVLATRALRYSKGSAGPSHRLHHCAGTLLHRRKVAKECTAEDINVEALRTLLRAANWQWMVCMGKKTGDQCKPPSTLTM